MSARYYPQCPYCKIILKGSDRAPAFGPLLGTCHHCGKHFLDPQAKELAFQPYEPLNLARHMLRSLMYAIVFGGFPPLLLTAFPQYQPLFSHALISAAAIFLLSLSIRLLRREKIEKDRHALWLESDRRLRDPKYATLLAQHGLPVPPNYLPPGFRRDPNAVIYKRLKTSLF